MSLAIAKQYIVLFFYVVAGVPIDTHKDLQIAAPIHYQQVVQDRIGPGIAGASFVQDGHLQTYLYRFEGRTMLKGLPASGATVILRLTTSRTSQVQKVVTDQDGSYQISFTFEGSRHEPVDFSMEAYMPDRKRVEFVSRRIIMREDDTTVTVQKIFELSTPGA